MILNRHEVPRGLHADADEAYWLPFMVFGSLHSIFAALHMSAAYLHVLHLVGLAASIYVDDIVIATKEGAKHSDFAHRRRPIRITKKQPEHFSI
jgi:hypothetical protein